MADDPTATAPSRDQDRVTDSAATPRTWPDCAQPTPDQLAEWLTRCTDEERVTLCGKMLDSSERAARCFLMNHDRLQPEVDRLRRVERYAREVMDALSAHGAGIVGHLLDDDENSGERLRRALRGEVER